MVRLIHHGLQYDVTVIDNGRFMRGGEECEFWKDREDIKKRYGEESCLYD